MIPDQNTTLDILVDEILSHRSDEPNRSIIETFPSDLLFNIAKSWLEAEAINASQTRITDEWLFAHSRVLSVSRLDISYWLSVKRNTRRQSEILKRYRSNLDRSLYKNQIEFDRLYDKAQQEAS